ncbi:MAG: SDR family oxidoreductase [FCB group bacterium]|nr:SDR family oxidoreductase [FCB group bacterium]
MDLGLKDKTALIAGASAGLGLAAAKVLFEEGARVAICSSNPEKIEQAAAALSTDKNRVLPVTCDLTEADQIDRLIGMVNKAFGSVDIVVTNCGGPPLGQHDTIGEEEWLLGYNKTFMSAIRLIDGVLPGMKERKFGRIILSTSVSAKQPLDNLLLSNSYRAGLLGYAKTISRELAPLGITVNTVLPGYTRTERLDYFADEISSSTGRSRDDIFADWVATIPVGRLGKPEELGALIAFLASDQAAYITGTSTAVDGGRTAGLL